jgi:hypothetical protein
MAYFIYNHYVPGLYRPKRGNFEKKYFGIYIILGLTTLESFLKTRVKWKG